MLKYPYTCKQISTVLGVAPLRKVEICFCFTYRKHYERGSMTRPTPPAGYIYLMRPVNSAMLYKIGSTVNLESRLKRMQRRFDCELEIAFSCHVQNYVFVENQLHIKYRRYHLAADWFALPEFAVDQIKVIGQ